MQGLNALLLALLAATLAASCGGGSSSPTDGSPAGGNGAVPAPWVRYQGIWSPTRYSSVGTIPPATLTLRALPGQTGIASNAVARVEVQLDQAAPVVLTAPNSTDAQGRPQYRFDFGQLAEAPECSGFFPTLPIGITVVDVTGFTYTKRVAACATFGSELDFGAFSDYGPTSARFSYSATAPITAFASRTSPAGYFDMLVPKSQGTFAGTLPAADGDALRLATNPNIPLPAGTRVTTRIDGGGGTFAESTLVAPATSQNGRYVSLGCCGPRTAVGETVAIQLAVFAYSTVQPYPPEATYTYAFRITDPATGAVVGNQTGTTYGTAFFPLQIQRGHAIEMAVTPNDPRIGVDASVRLGPTGGDTASASSNEVGTPARFKVFCCTP